MTPLPAADFGRLRLSSALGYFGSIVVVVYNYKTVVADSPPGLLIVYDYVCPQCLNSNFLFVFKDLL